MTRKTLIWLAALFATVVSATAQDYAGWYKYPVYCDTITTMVETAEKVYYTSGGNLFSYSPADKESYAYDMLNSLSDRDIKQIYHNAQKKYILVAYDNSNIDLIYDNGKIINLPDIKNASIADKGINSVAFGHDRIAVATDFGLVVFSDTRYEVVESGIYGGKLNGVCFIDGKIMISGPGTEYKMLYSPVEERHNSLDKYTELVPYIALNFTAVDDQHIAIRTIPPSKLILRKINFDTNSWVDVNLGGNFTSPSEFYSCADGVYTYTPDKIILFKEGGNFTIKDLPKDADKMPVAMYASTDKIWCGLNDGIVGYDISGDNPSIFQQSNLYPNCITDKRVGYMRWTPDNKRLYISNMEVSISRPYAKNESSTNYQTTNYIEDGKVVDVSLKNASGDHLYTTKYQAQFGNKRMYSAPTWMVQDLFDPDKYYQGNYFEGVYVIRRNLSTGIYEEIGKFDATNSPITDKWGDRVLWVDIDRDGNLWVGFEEGSHLAVLPAAKLKQDPKNITVADWKTTTKIDADYKAKDFMALICKKSNMFFYSSGAFNEGFIAIDTKGTYTNLGDDAVLKWTKVTDQDGNNIGFNHITYFLEDKRGCVWVGTTTGVFEITNPSQATDPNMTVRRIKVPRNDGTNYADYLLDSDQINWMALDPAGRKWIATESSGIYLVSETGDEILRHYDRENSPLPENSVWTIECDPYDNTVYVGASTGLYSFKSDASPGHQDFSDIYAYPNPVRPEYSGVVTITGLVANSIVKITDTAGNVVCQTRSEGGMATWDVCGANGQRVKSGVYYAYASENNSGTSSTGAVTKILVID